MEQSNTLYVDDLRHCEYFNCKSSVFISPSFCVIIGEREKKSMRSSGQRSQK